MSHSLHASQLGKRGDDDILPASVKQVTRVSESFSFRVSMAAAAKLFRTVATAYGYGAAIFGTQEFMATIETSLALIEERFNRHVERKPDMTDGEFAELSARFRTHMGPLKRACMNMACERAAVSAWRWPITVVSSLWAGVEIEHVRVADIKGACRQHLSAEEAHTVLKDM